MVNESEIKSDKKSDHSSHSDPVIAQRASSRNRTVNNYKILANHGKTQDQQIAAKSEKIDSKTTPVVNFEKTFKVEKQIQNNEPWMPLSFENTSFKPQTVVKDQISNDFHLSN